MKEFPGKSDRALAEQCGVDNKTIAAAREIMQVSEEFPQIETRTVTRTGPDGTPHTYTINTANIGRKPDTPAGEDRPDQDTDGLVESDTAGSPRSRLTVTRSEPGITEPEKIAA